MELKKFKVEVFNSTGLPITEWEGLAKTAKGIGKINKALFKRYRESEFTWTITEVEDGLNSES